MEVSAWTCPANSDMSEFELRPEGRGSLVLYSHESTRK